MSGFIAAWVLGVGAIGILALVFPCKGCRLRRERMKLAYETWKKSRDNA